jgi:hypothetical protein
MNTTTEICPNCQEQTTDSNPMVADYYTGGGVCESCYDPTPWGYDYSPGFEMEHDCLAETGCCGKTR